MQPDVQSPTLFHILIERLEMLINPKYPSSSAKVQNTKVGGFKDCSYRKNKNVKQKEKWNQPQAITFKRGKKEGQFIKS